MDHRALVRRSLVIATALMLTVGTPMAAHAAGVEPAKATPAQREAAQAHFLKGRELYNAKKYDGAIGELNASLDAVASPNTRLELARCLRDMGRLVAADAEYQRTVADAKANAGDDNHYEKAAQAAAEERAQLASKLGFVDLRLSHAGADTTVKVGGDLVPRAAWTEPVAVNPGTVEVVADTPGKPPVRQQVTVAAGQHQEATLDAAPEAPVVAEKPPETDDGEKPKYRPYVYATAGLAALGLTTFIVAGSMANSTFSKLEDSCGSGPCPKGHEDDISSGKTQQTFANIGLAVFVVSAAASVTLFVIDKPKKSAPAAATARVTAGPSYVGLQGAF